MRSRKIKILLTVVLTALLVSVFAVTGAAAITVEKGTVVGLDASKSYEYAPVTLADYMAPIYTALSAGTTEVKGLSAGMYYFRETSATAVTAVYIPGTAKETSTIGKLVYNESWGKNELQAKSATYHIAGVWTGKGTASNPAFATYFLSEIGGSHITGSEASQAAAGTISKRKLQQKIEAIVFKYAYLPEQIIHVDDLYTMSFNTGIRLGSLIYVCDTLPQTKYVLYTMQEDGSVTTHEALFDSVFDIAQGKTSCHNSHTINIDTAFPDAEGWVIGLDIYPYGEVPGAADFDGAYYEEYSSHYYNTMFYIEFKPSGYATKYSAGTSIIAPQYNGVNKSYVKGYSDGSFAPDADITLAETAEILARLMLNGSAMPENLGVSFADVTVNDWYYRSIAYLEKLGTFDYKEGNILAPNKPVTRGEFAQMLFSTSQAEVQTGKAFKDVADSDAYFDAVVYLKNMGIIEGYGDGTFRAGATLTRAEAVTIFNRMLNLIANEDTVNPELLETAFNDISGHWAEYEILMAANNNVKSKHHEKANASKITLTDTLATFDTNQMAINVERSSGKVVSVINKYDNTNIAAASASPWFIYITTDGGVNFYPASMDVVDNRLKVTFSNKTEAYFIVGGNDNYVSFELDSRLPKGINILSFGKTTVDYEFSEDPDSYRISSVAMNANTDYVSFPGGKAKTTNARVMYNTGSTMGGKMAITFSKFGDRKTGEHRTYLKQIVDDIDPSVGTTSKHGGPYTIDNSDIYGDYLITSSGLTPAVASSTADLLNKYSINQLDIHQGGSSFIQGDFNFKCAAVSGETFTTAAQFKERVGRYYTEKGIQLGLHTYSSLVASAATTILSDPKWQKDLLYKEEEVLTLASDVTASAKEFLTNEDASGIQLYGYAAGGGTSTLPWSGPNTNYFLIDEELIRVSTADATGLHTVTRAVCGTKEAAHLAGAEIRHLLGHYSMFQSRPGSDLFYHIADLTAQAYNDGGFEMIYLDGLESFARDSMIDTSLTWYYYASFIQRIVSQCEVDPIIEGSSIPQGFWAARGRAGAVDHATREFKKYNQVHALGNYSSYHNYYYTATLGWFNYGPDVSMAYKNTTYKTMFRDDLDHMGSLGIAFDFSTVYNHAVTSIDNNKTLSNNCLYFNLYSRLRKGGYFSDTVKKTLREGCLEGKEYKLEKQSDGSWAFREMKYLKYRVFDMADDTFVTHSFTNPFDAQTPYIRIEQRYSTLGANEVTLIAFDETADVAAGKYPFTETNLSAKQAFRIKVTGNGTEGSAILLAMGTTAKSEVGRLDFFIPTDFTGTREFILMDMDNADFDGHNFMNINGINYGIYRSSFYYTGVNSVQVYLSGDCTGVKIDDLRACTPVNAPAVNPSITLGGKTMTFNTTVRSGEYIEYFPELNKAYKHSYNVLAAGTNGNTPTVSEIQVSGSVITAPAGDFEVTYNATGTTDAPLRAKIVLGLKNPEIIANESGWDAPDVELPANVEYITLT